MTTLPSRLEASAEQDAELDGLFAIEMGLVPEGAVPVKDSADGWGAWAYRSDGGRKIARLGQFLVRGELVTVPDTTDMNAMLALVKDMRFPPATAVVMHIAADGGYSCAGIQTCTDSRQKPDIIGDGESTAFAARALAAALLRAKGGEMTMPTEPQCPSGWCPKCKCIAPYRGGVHLHSCGTQLLYEIPTKDMKLPPNWLREDVARAVARVKEWMST